MEKDELFEEFTGFLEAAFRRWNCHENYLENLEKNLGFPGRCGKLTLRKHARINSSDFLEDLRK